VLAHRTSPTNLGLYLLSIVSARDLGWAGTVDAIERLESTLATMSRIELCHGHFFNWYDTQDCGHSSAVRFRPWTAATWPRTC